MSTVSNNDKRCGISREALIELLTAATFVIETLHKAFHFKIEDLPRSLSLLYITQQGKSASKITIAIARPHNQEIIK